jgi:hypothetical protein
VFAEHGKSGFIVLHMTNHMMIPIVGAADIALDGEDHVIFPEMHKDFMDFWSPERMRLDYWRPWGVPVSFLQEYQGKWNSQDLKRVMRAYTGMCLLNDVLPSANPNGNNPECWRARDAFGIAADDVSFVPYWTAADTGLKSDAKDVQVSAWKRPGKVLLAVVNRGEAGTSKVNVPLAALRLTGGPFTARDAETGEPLSLDGTILSVTIPRHDYKQVLVSGQ